jgi:hypothetical protein
MPANAVPTIIAASYDGGLKVDAQWNPVPGATLFSVGVLQGGTVLAQGSGFGVAGSVTLTSPLVPGTTYQVTAAVKENGTQGPWGTRMTLIVGRLQTLAASYDGALAVSANWTLPATDLVNAAAVAVLDAGTGSPLAQQLMFGDSGKLALPASLRPDGSYTLSASAAFGTSTGPPTSMPLVPIAPKLRAAAYDQGQHLVQVFIAAPLPDGCLPGAILYADGQPVTERVWTPGLLVRITVTAALDPASAWTARPFWMKGTARGPLGPAAEIPVAGPVIRDIRWLGGQLALRWENQPGPPYPTGAQIDVSATDEGIRGASLPGATSGAFTPSPPLLESSAYTATVASLRGVAQGAASAGVPVVAAGTALDSANYDGRTLNVTWSAQPPPNATRATLLVTAGNATIAEAPGSGGAVAVTVPLDPAAAYSAALRWSAFPVPSHGPAGAATALISAAPTVSAVALADGVQATIAPPRQTAGIARYVAVLERGGTVVARSAPVDAGQAPVATIPYQEAAGATGLAVRAQGLGPLSGVQVGGPFGPPTPLVAVAPEIRAATLSGTTLTADWVLPDAPPGALTATTLVVTPSTGQAAAFPGLPGTSAQVTLPAELISPDVLLTLSATATGPAGSSPATRITLVSTLPSVTSAAWDGQRLSAVWAWPHGALGVTVATAYRLSIVSAGRQLGSVVVAGLTGTLTPTALLDPAAEMTVEVDALAGIAECLAATGPLLLAGAPALESAVVAGTSVTLAWTGPAAPSGAVSGLLAVFASPGYPPQTAAVSTQQPTATIPVIAPDPLVPLSVSIRATGVNASGPAGNELPVLRRVPVITAVRTVASGNPEVSWAPVPGGVREYLATLYKGGTAISTEVVAGLTATLSPGTTDPGASYTVGVTARAGAAAGPESPRAAAILTAPALVQPGFDGRTLTVAVTAPGGGAPAPDHYGLALLRDGSEVARAIAAAPTDGAGLTLPVDGPVDPAGAFTLTASAIAELATGPAASIAVLLGVPVVTTVRCGQKLVVAVSPGALSATGLALSAGLWVNGAKTATQPVGDDGTAEFDIPDSGTVTVAARASADGATGPWSAQVPTLTTTPVIAAARYDGAQAELSWSPPGQSVVTVTGTDGRVVAESDVSGGIATLPFPAGAGLSFTVTVTQRAGIAVGPSATLALVTTVPLLALATDATGGSVTVTFTAPAGTTALLPLLVADGAAAPLAEIGTSSPATIDLPADTPPGAFLALRARAGAALGPQSALAPIVQGPPIGVALCFADGVLSATWAGPGDPRVDGAIVTLAVPGHDDQRFRVSGESWSQAFSPVPTGATVTIAAAAGAGSGPSAHALAALLVPPVMAAVTFDDFTLTAAWTAPESGPAPDGYLVTVWDGRTALAQRAVTATTAVVTVPAGAGHEPLSVTVTPVLGTVTGPPSAPVAVLQASPSVTSVAVDPLTGVATVTFAAVANPPASGYDVQLLREGVPFGAPVRTAASAVTLPGAIVGQWDLSVVVRAHATVSSVALTGPYGPACGILTAQPALRASDYDGITASLTWDAASVDCGGYRASVVASGRGEPAATADASAAARAIRFPVTLPDTTSDWRFALQALRGQSTGPAVATPLFSAGIYLRSDGQPRVFRASTLALTPAATTAYLPEIGPLSGLPIPPDSGNGTPALQITANTDPASSAAFPYLLTIGGAALTFDRTPVPAIRTDVQDAYTTLLTKAETGGATPWGIVQLQQVVSRLMPQTFAELLLYAYGLSPTGYSAELRPGLVLRVASSGFDLVPGSRPPAYASGYADGASLDYEVADYLDGASASDDAAWLLGFDSFLSWLTAGGAITVPAPESADGLQSGAAEAVDLYYPSFRQPFYRLFFPTQVQPTTPPAQSQTDRQFTLAAAATYGLISASGPAPSPGVAVAYFRGRSVLKLAIRVTVDGGEQLVPVGTTVGNVLDRLARRPPRAATELLGLTLERPLGPAVLDPARYDAAACERVRLDYGGLHTFDRRDALSLPLLHGDRLTLGAWG